MTSGRVAELVTHTTGSLTCASAQPRREATSRRRRSDEVELALVGHLALRHPCREPETFRHLLTLADRAYLVVWLLGGPPPAELALVRRLAELQPDARFRAVFDLDRAASAIARLLEERNARDRRWCTGFRVRRPRSYASRKASGRRACKQFDCDESGARVQPRRSRDPSAGR